MIYITERLGRRVISIFEYSLSLLAVAYISLRTVVLDRSQNFRSLFSVISAQVYFTGWQALPLISVLGLAAGSVVVMQSTTQLNFMGGLESVGKLMVVVIVREMSPLLTALIVVARSGTAVSTELGNMKVNREIEALKSMGIDPVSYIIFPRLVGGVISVVCLSFYFNFFSMLGAFLLAKLYFSVSFSYFWESVSYAYSEMDTFLFLLKNIFSGFIIFCVSSYQGLKVSKGPFEVPQATTKAVMNTLTYVIVFNFAVTLCFYLFQMRGLLW